jgi:predicted acetyltransferase
MANASKSAFFLVELDGKEGKEIYEMLQRIGPDENAFNNEVNGMSYEQFKSWLSLQMKWARGEDLPDGYVKQWTYWLVEENKPVGYGKLRERLTEKSRNFGGNIGFAIDPLSRGKGYGYILFDMLLIEAPNKGIREVLSTVERNNIPSKLIHEKCGGVIIEENEQRFIFDFSDRIRKRG